MRYLVALAVLVLAAAGTAAGVITYRDGQSARAQAEIVAAADAFLATLDEERLRRATRDFEDGERFEFFYTPVVRDGLPLRDMTLEQRTAALQLLRTVTSTQGYLKATGVMQLEAILGELEGRPDRRDPENYHFWIFGSPSAHEPWGWRFEGHHISLNFTSAHGLTVSNPSFIGANPATVRSGPFAGWRLLAAEEDLARALVHSLDAGQRARAIISETTFRDILTGNQRRASLERMDGLPVSAMRPEQRDLLMRLLAEYVDNADPAIAEPRYARIREVGIEQLHFAWAGSLERGEPHYYRIHGPTVLIEYDNTQSNANHVHSVWRDLENDFGEDILRRHYETASPDHGHDHDHEHGHTHGQDGGHRH